MAHESADRIVDLYQRHARAWDETRGRSLFEKSWLDRFVDLLPPCGTVLDAGCGGGEPIAAYLISRDLRLTGIDSSPELIALCRARFPQLTFHVADMRRIRSYPDGYVVEEMGTFEKGTVAPGCPVPHVRPPVQEGA